MHVAMFLGRVIRALSLRCTYEICLTLCAQIPKNVSDIQPTV